MEMTKKRISRYRNLRREILILEERLLGAQGAIASDTVTTAAEFPYDKHVISIKGYTTEHVQRLRLRLDYVKSECIAIEEFIESIEDTVLYQIISLRYRDGMTTQSTAERMNYSESHIRNLINNFFSDKDAKDNRK